MPLFVYGVQAIWNTDYNLNYHTLQFNFNT